MKINPDRIWQKDTSYYDSITTGYYFGDPVLIDEYDSIMYIIEVDDNHWAYANGGGGKRIVAVVNGVWKDYPADFTPTERDGMYAIDQHNWEPAPDDFAKAVREDVAHEGDAT